MAGAMAAFYDVNPISFLICAGSISGLDDARDTPSRSAPLASSRGLRAPPSSPPFFLSALALSLMNPSTRATLTPTVPITHLITRFSTRSIS
eukprot:CAMPEP_0174909514 /NCGR_PEP_ID=MMETSP0167-20121228/68931_1 /TAXON_ID=38298 /ORGANISM="Rhodella maculata, Strain CCMP736" /LENGTH=91 /DNA_ID=CAMNT_0016153533 /DNA_START=35 /DNA_END=307 /DNA_ORIENTATION=+